MKRPGAAYGTLLAVLLLVCPRGARRAELPPPPEYTAVIGVTPLAHFNRLDQSRHWGKTADLSAISRYDNLLRAAADSIGWDWRLLSAVVYHESRFNNNARSSKGARGLMQVRSGRYTDEELANPARNIAVGSSYLQKLQSRFSVEDPAEAVKFALAAYNVGESRLSALISRADSLGLDSARWDSVATLLPQGHHTVSYVSDVLDTYAYYSRQYPR